MTSTTQDPGDIAFNALLDARRGGDETKSPARTFALSVGMTIGAVNALCPLDSTPKEPDHAA